MPRKTTVHTWRFGLDAEAPTLGSNPPKRPDFADTKTTGVPDMPWAMGLATLADCCWVSPVAEPAHAVTRQAAIAAKGMT